MKGYHINEMMSVRAIYKIPLTQLCHANVFHSHTSVEFYQNSQLFEFQFLPLKTGKSDKYF